ncbi:O-antigen ligase family protein [Curtobacterium sp. UCD-KPL2560]|uniref:O-antigen ligase family protein n=1 Tax=Curtobacterium sp. UCD-KPL2560 TaxID=1885315 RepID=UPI0034558A76
MSLLWPNLAVNPLLGAQLAILGVSAFALATTADKKSVLWAYRGLLTGASLSSAVAILQQFRLIQTELWTDSSGLSRPTGLVEEPDWAGFFAACALLLLVRGVVRRGRVWWLLFAINSACVIFCLARASWLALAVSFALVLFAVATKRRTAYPIIVGRRLVGAASIALFLVIVVDRPFREIALNRVLSIFSDEHRDLNAVYRQQQLDGLWNLVQTAPWHGWGLTASARVSSTGVLGVQGGNSVPTNWVLGLASDAGILAFPFFVMVLVLAVLRAGSVSAQVLAMVAVNSLFSNLLFSPIWWLALALAASEDGALVSAAPGKGSSAAHRLRGRVGVG